MVELTEKDIQNMSSLEIYKEICRKTDEEDVVIAYANDVCYIFSKSDNYTTFSISAKDYHVRIPVTHMKLDENRDGIKKLYLYSYSQNVATIDLSTIARVS